MLGNGPGKREVDLYVRTYTTLLQSSGAIGVSSLEPAHLTAASSLHAGALEPAPDMNAFIYSTQRLPACIVDVRHIVLGQSVADFARGGFVGMSTVGRARARPAAGASGCYDGNETLAAYIASTSDLDDLIPTIVAYQIEWNKFHRFFEADPELLADRAEPPPRTHHRRAGARSRRIGERLLLSASDWLRLQSSGAHASGPTCSKMAEERKRYDLQMLGGTLFRLHPLDPPVVDAGGRAAATNTGSTTGRSISSRRIRTASSTSSPGARDGGRRSSPISSVEASHPELLPELEQLEAGETRSSWDNLLYFAARHYFAGPQHGTTSAGSGARKSESAASSTSNRRGAIDVGIQVIDLANSTRQLRSRDSARRRASALDPDADRRHHRSTSITRSGVAAYHLMTQVGDVDRPAARRLRSRQGGDAQRPDRRRHARQRRLRRALGQHLLVRQLLSATTMSRPSSVFGAALDNQKAVTVKGTYLQNQGYLDFYYRENYTVVEMEAGPYLNAIYEDVFLGRHPYRRSDQSRRTSAGTIDLGIIHYASDTPYTRAQTLGARGLSYYGMDSTYASTIAILRRVFSRSGVVRAPAEVR